MLEYFPKQSNNIKKTVIIVALTEGNVFTS